MPKNFENDDKHKDDLLAEFADQVIDGQSPQVTDSPQETALRGLQEVILEIHNSVRAENPDEQTADQIKHNLLEEWKRGVAKRETWLEKIFPRKQNGWRSTSRRNRSFAVQIAVAVVVVLTILVTVVPSSDPQPGTALGEGNLDIILFLLLILGGSYLWWTRRNK